MCKVILFGGTTEGRRLHEFLGERKIPAITCVATQYGEKQIDGHGVLVGRLDKTEMARLIGEERPKLVIDATHPYALEVSENISAACLEAGVECIHVSRGSYRTENCFGSLESLIEKMKSTTGDIFVTLGVKSAKALTALPNFQNRLWLRILPSPDGINECVALGYNAKRLICMQGPFSKELNIAMLKHTGAKILVTKESGDTGGFMEKITAARELGIETLILGRPEDTGGMGLDEIFMRIMEL